jgi:hypothetical protein
MADEEVSEEVKPKRGRPLIEIDYDNVKAMRKIQCTEKEIASVLEMSYRGFQERKKRDEVLRDALEFGEANGKVSLRREMYRKAMTGNVSMLIWMSKNILGMSDRLQTSHSDAKTGVLVVPQAQSVEDWAKDRKREELDYDETEVTNF